MDWTYYHYAYTNQHFGTTKLMKQSGKRHETTHNEDRILGADPPSNRLCIMKLHNLFYNTFFICLCIHADTKASSTYLIRFVDGERYIVVDRNCYRNLHPQPQRRAPFYFASHHALGTPSSHHHLCNFLIWTNFWASWSLLMRQNQATSDIVVRCRDDMVQET